MTRTLALALTLFLGSGWRASAFAPYSLPHSKTQDHARQRRRVSIEPRGRRSLAPPLECFATAAAASGGDASDSSGSGLGSSTWGWLSSVEVKRLAVWLGFTGLVIFMRDFYSLFLGTFILTLIGNNTVNFIGKASTGFRKSNNKKELPAWLDRSLPERLKMWMGRVPRSTACMVYIVTMLGLISVVTLSIIPRIVREGQFVVARITQSPDPYLYIATAMHDVLGDYWTTQIDSFLKSQESAASISDQIFSASSQGSRSLTSGLVEQSWTGEKLEQLAGMIQGLLKKNVVSGIRAAKEVIDFCAGAVVTASASLLFSFLLVWDFPNISRGVGKLKKSRVAFAYNEIGPWLQKFARLVGQAFEIQIIVAAINTALTALGMWFIGLPAKGFFSLIVFICSFIPVAGIALSTVPMLLVALSDSGVRKALEVMGMVAAVHAVEAYVIFPPLYSKKLKLHPLLVLLALYMTEHIVGVQGLFLALPVTVFLVNLLMGDYKTPPRLKEGQ